MKHIICNFQPTDSQDIIRITLSAFNQYKDQYTDWQTFSKNLENVATQATQATLGELLIATLNNNVVGAVVYVPPTKTTNFFPAGGAVIRMLVVDPKYRGLGIGKSLTEKCLEYAARDLAPFISLHTSPIMKIALSMYLRMGFKFEQEVSPICGAPYNIYIKHLEV